MAAKKKITNSAELKSAITELEREVHDNEYQMKENFLQVKENLHPKRVIKNTFSYAAETPEVQRTLVNTAIGFILGYASRKATEFLTEESLNKTVEGIVSHNLTRLEDKNPDSVLSRVITLFRKHTPPSSPIYPLIKYR